jgi:putative glutamine amidotransferase
MAKPVIGISPSIEHGRRRGDAYFLYTSYVEEMSRAGAVPFILPFARSREEAREILAHVDGVLLTGGDDLDPTLYGQTTRHADRIGSRMRAESDLHYARESLERLKAVLGVCLGVQVMNVAFGGTLLQFIPEDVPGAAPHEDAEAATEDAPQHPVRIEPGSLLLRLLGTETAVVSSFHHQAVAKVAPGFRVAARSPEGVIEAIEREDHPFYLGVQWHPERMPAAPITERLFRGFIGAARGASVRAG